MCDNVLQLQEVGAFEAQNCLPPQNLIRSTKLHLTTEPPISCRCGYGLVLFSVELFINVVTHSCRYTQFVKNNGWFCKLFFKVLNTKIVNSFKQRSLHTVRYTASSLVHLRSASPYSPIRG